MFGLGGVLNYCLSSGVSDVFQDFGGGVMDCLVNVHFTSGLGDL
jgi:hypothetical protein